MLISTSECVLELCKVVVLLEELVPDTSSTDRWAPVHPETDRGLLCLLREQTFEQIAAISCEIPEQTPEGLALDIGGGVGVDHPSLGGLTASHHLFHP